MNVWTVNVAWERSDGCQEMTRRLEFELVKPQFDFYLEVFNQQVTIFIAPWAAQMSAYIFHPPF